MSQYLPNVLKGLNMNNREWNSRENGKPSKPVPARGEYRIAAIRPLQGRIEGGLLATGYIRGYSHLPASRT